MALLGAGRRMNAKANFETYVNVSIYSTAVPNQALVLLCFVVSDPDIRDISYGTHASHVSLLVLLH
jgi:hypothetical protein